MIGEEDKNVMFSVADVATILNVHANTVRKWSDEGRIKSCRVGARGDRGFTPDDLKEFIESSLVAPLEFYGSSMAGDGNERLTLLNIN
jgi:excisionase family DNA binding protein